MVVIGLTGGIASGKSTISNMLMDMKIPVIDADVIARDVVKPATDTLKRLVQKFGEDILNIDGTLNRKKLSNVVFNDRESLKQLNLIIHPAIKNAIMNKLNEYRKSKEKYCVVDAALLIEANFIDIVDCVILVYVNRKTQVERLMNRDKISMEEAERKIDSQMSLDEKMKYADYLVDNNHDVENTRLQLKSIIKEIFNLEERDG